MILWDTCYTLFISAVYFECVMTWFYDATGGSAHHGKDGGLFFAFMQAVIMLQCVLCLISCISIDILVKNLLKKCRARVILFSIISAFGPIAFILFFENMKESEPWIALIVVIYLLFCLVYKQMLWRFHFSNKTKKVDI